MLYLNSSKIYNGIILKQKACRIRIFLLVKIDHNNPVLAIVKLQHEMVRIGKNKLTFKISLYVGCGPDCLHTKMVHMYE